MKYVLASVVFLVISLAVNAQQPAASAHTMGPETVESLIAKRDALETILDGFEVWVIVFGILVVVGVGGETIYGVRTWWNNRKLHVVEQSIDRLRQSEIATLTSSGESLTLQMKLADARIAEAQRDSSDANERAAEAQKNLALAEQHSSEANAKAEGFRLDIAKAQESAAKATEETARITKENLTLDAEVINLRQAAAPRRLTEAQKIDLISKLSASPAFSVSFLPVSSNGTKESFDFQDDLVDVFVRMKLMAPGGPPTGKGLISLTPSLAKGVIVLVKNPTEFPAAALVLINFLKALGFEASATAEPDTASYSPNEMKILVSVKQ